MEGLYAPTTLPPGERVPGDNWYEACHGLRVGLDATRERKILYSWESNLGHSFSVFNILIHSNSLRVLY
jgi:hypothetical protein